MDEDRPHTPADPRPDNEPYFISERCSVCNHKLELADKNLPENEKWYDEWKCYNEECNVKGIYLDVPDKEFQDLHDRSGEFSGSIIKSQEYSNASANWSLSEYIRGISLGLMIGSLVIYQYTKLPYLFVVVFIGIVLTLISSYMENN